MLDYINWYLVELRLRLQPSLSSNTIETILSEVESHLRETSLRLQETPGMDRAKAELEAVRAFGKPHVIATGYLRESNPKFFGLAPEWPVLASGLIALGCWVFNWISRNGYFDNFGETWQNGLATLVGVSALVLFFRACRAAHRSFFGPILTIGTGISIGLVFLLSFWIVGSKDSHQGFSRLHLSRDVEVAQTSLKRLDRLEAYLQAGKLAYSKAKSAADLPMEYKDLATAAATLDQSRLLDYGRLHDAEGTSVSNIFTIPAGSVSAYVDGRIWGVYTSTSFAEVKKAWLADAQNTIDSIEPQRKGLWGLLGSAQEARSGRLFFFNPRVFGEAVAWSIVFLPVLLLLDACAFAWKRRRPVWPDRATA